MSLKDKLKNIGICASDYSRGFTHGIFAIPRFVYNFQTSTNSYLFGSSAAYGTVLYWCFSDTLNLPPNAYPLIALIPITSNVISFTNVFEDIKRKKRSNNNQKQTEAKPKLTTPSNINPWCELEDIPKKEEKTVDPWCKLESIVQ